MVSMPTCTTRPPILSRPTRCDPNGSKIQRWLTYVVKPFSTFDKATFAAM